jgi:hypothetical protein
MSFLFPRLPNNRATCHQCGAEYDIHGFHSCGSIDDAVKEALAANNAEWVEWIEKFIISVQQTNFNDGSSFVDEINISMEQWQERKRSVL